MKVQEASCEYDSKEMKLKAKKAATEQRYCSAVLLYEIYINSTFELNLLARNHGQCKYLTAS